MRRIRRFLGATRSEFTIWMFRTATELGIGTIAHYSEEDKRRAGRHGLAYTRAGRLNLRNARHADDPSPADPLSSSTAARIYSRAYLHHLVKAGEILGMMLLTEINLAYYQDLMDEMRRAIATGSFADFCDAAKTAWRTGETSGKLDG